MSSVHDITFCPGCGKPGEQHDIKRHVKRCTGNASGVRIFSEAGEKIQTKEEKMLIARPFLPNLNVEDVPAPGLPITIISVRETDNETKAKIENAREFTIEFTCEKLDKGKFPEQRAQRMFSPTSDMAKQLSVLSGQKIQSDGTYPIDETKLPKVKAVLYRIKSVGKFSGQDTLTLKKA